MDIPLVDGLGDSAEDDTIVVVILSDNKSTSLNSVVNVVDRGLVDTNPLLETVVKVANY